MFVCVPAIKTTFRCVNRNRLGGLYWALLNTDVWAAAIWYPKWNNKKRESKSVCACVCVFVFVYLCVNLFFAISLQIVNIFTILFLSCFCADVCAQMCVVVAEG